MNTVYHEPVLVREVIEYLVTSADGIYVDATVGGGGHTLAILRRLSDSGRVICIDRDADAIDETRKRLKDRERNLLFMHDVFSAAGDRLRRHGIEQIDGILFDLGVSSFQLDTAERGFSYQRDAPLDMRMDARTEITAYAVINGYAEHELADVIYRYGEERRSRQIARRIAEERLKRPIKTTGDLAEIVRAVVGERHLIKTLARIFQALRIEVNAELDHAAAALAQTPALLRSGGRLVVISYHSLEDRQVKNFLKAESATRIRADDPLAREDITVRPNFRLLTRKPVLPDAGEIRRNPRSRSAKLRAAERV
jgi:16S rRNA (cytosine1402-N4)-methyltransferase